MKVKNLFSILIALYICFASSFFRAYAAELPASDYEYYKVIGTQGTQSKNNYVIKVDREVYGNSQASLSDIRIFKDEEYQIPYEIFTFPKKTTAKSITSKIIENKVDKDSSNTLIVDIGTLGTKHNKLTLDIVDRNFGRRIKIEGSSDRKNWVTLTKDAYIYDFTFGGANARSGSVKWSRDVDSKYMVDFSYRSKSRDTTVQYKETTSRFLKITIFESETEKPLLIENVKIAIYTELPASKTEYPTTIKESTLNKEKKTTEIILDMGFKNIPINELLIFSNSTNYYRTFYLQGSKDLDTWKGITKSEIFKYNIENFSDSKNKISFQEIRYRYIKLIILNRDNPPIRINRVKAFGLDRLLAFPYDEKASLRLYYGNKYMKKPAYDYSRYVRKANIRNFSQLDIGSQKKNPYYVLKEPKKPWSEKNPHLLWAVLAFIVIVLLYFVKTMLVKIK